MNLLSYTLPQNAILADIYLSSFRHKTPSESPYSNLLTLLYKPALIDSHLHYNPVPAPQPCLDQWPCSTTAASFPPNSLPASSLTAPPVPEVTMTGKGACDVVVVDVSNRQYPGTVNQMELWEVIIKCTVVALLLLVAIVGNLLIVVIVSTSRKMRSTTNYYIVNLAVADLLVACFPMWIYVTTNVTDGWILGAFFCKFNAFVQTSAMCAISFTMMAIAGDRFFAIVFPLTARVTHSKVKVVIAIVWIAAISIGIPPCLYYTYTERQWKDYKETFCTDVWPMLENSDGTCDQGVTSKRAYWTVVVAVLNWIPMLMMTINYAVIIHKLQFNRLYHGGSDSISAVQRRSARKVIKMLFSLLVAFMVCTIPFQVSTLYENYKNRRTTLPPWYQPVYFSAINLMYAHSSINPILYGAMNQTFRRGFQQLFNKIRGRKNPTWETRMTVLDSVRAPRIKTVDQGENDTDVHSPVADMVQNSAYINPALSND